MMSISYRRHHNLLVYSPTVSLLYLGFQIQSRLLQVLWLLEDRLLSNLVLYMIHREDDVYQQSQQKTRIICEQQNALLQTDHLRLLQLQTLRVTSTLFYCWLRICSFDFVICHPCSHFWTFYHYQGYRDLQKSISSYGFHRCNLDSFLCQKVPKHYQSSVNRAMYQLLSVFRPLLLQILCDDTCFLS